MIALASSPAESHSATLAISGATGKSPRQDFGDKLDVVVWAHAQATIGLGCRKKALAKLGTPRPPSFETWSSWQRASVSQRGAQPRRHTIPAPREMLARHLKHLGCHSVQSAGDSLPVAAGMVCNEDTAYIFSGTFRIPHTGVAFPNARPAREESGVQQ